MFTNRSICANFLTSPKQAATLPTSTRETGNRCSRALMHAKRPPCADKKCEQLLATRSNACSTSPVQATLKSCTNATHSRRSATTPAVDSIDDRRSPLPYPLPDGAAEAVELPFAAIIPPPAAPRSTGINASVGAAVFRSSTLRCTTASTDADVIYAFPSATPAAVTF